MDSRAKDTPDSRIVTAGGRIPGQPGAPAFTLTVHDPSSIPVLVSVPHSGRAYPPSLIEGMRHPAHAGLRLEDRYVDVLGKRIADETGAALLVAHAPRAMIDLNRATDDVDWEMVSTPPPPGTATAGLAGRARGGLGLVPRRLPGFGELWKRRIDGADLSARIDDVHEPYHRVLGETLTALRDRWGAALLIDLHSMPPLRARGAEPAARIVVGDRFGASCAGELVGAAFGYLGRSRMPSAHNRPYAGGYVLERHAARKAGLHCLQIEVDRSSYLDSSLTEPGPRLDDMTDVLAGLVRRLAGEVAELGREGDSDRWRMAAE
ncbi:N-formylglutamate amidohydrolase [Novosphingobium sp. ZN18A2]|uniref:N-formylglutamate amidohydrolase n=1 Tax=Novosphingobium sp. ZN18A2 TaxID=3079861 RepID=UPI0030D114CB